MTKLSWLCSAALLFTVGAFAAPASAAPVGNLSGLAQENSSVETVHYGRRCWRHRGHWHCPSYRRYSYYDYGYPRYGAYYGGGYPYYGYGYGPSIAFSFGGGRHWGGRHWGRRGW